MFKEKAVASAYHLAMSVTVVSVFLLIVYLVWYPYNYAELSGLSEILTIILVIDVILGPILTFIVFKKNKKTLKLDLTVIATFQIIAFIYGAMTVYQGHPSYVVFAGNRFKLVSADHASPSRASLKEFQVSTLGSPTPAFAKFPDDDIEERNNLLFSNDIELHPEHYRPIKDNLASIIKREIDTSVIFKDKKDKQALTEYLSKHNTSEDKLIFLPIEGKKADAVVALNRNTGEIIGTINVYPWPN